MTDLPRPAHLPDEEEIMLAERAAIVARTRVNFNGVADAVTALRVNVHDLTRMGMTTATIADAVGVSVPELYRQQMYTMDSGDDVK